VVHRETQLRVDEQFCATFWGMNRRERPGARNEVPKHILSPLISQSVQIRQQIIDLLLIEDLGVAWHLVAAEANDVGDAIVISRHSAHRQILPLENALHTGPLPSPGRIWRVTPVTIIVINATPLGLLWIESELRIALTALDIATSHTPQRNGTDTEV
jgi:hypothetical protein